MKKTKQATTQKIVSLAVKGYETIFFQPTASLTFLLNLFQDELS
jgi:hypothetical protein